MREEARAAAHERGEKNAEVAEGRAPATAGREANVAPAARRQPQGAGRTFLLAVWGALLGAMAIEARRSRAG